MDKNIIYPESTLEEQLIIIVDKYISKKHQPGDKSFSYQIYLIFVGYHLKYFYPKNIYSRSNRNIDNIMAMFSSVYKSLTSNLLHRLNNKEGVLRELNSLVNFIDNNQEKAEEIYATVRAQYEVKVIENELTYEAVRTRTVRL
ncbi:hypothetical protein GMF55_08320 [Salmonella enterica]|nr:hypothetical protein [Salmonella enterica]EFP3446243.1 hypothetical protein [Salmonella enterica]EGO2244443.1 hypothetical protein [Salmonella enterica]EJE6975919.1 hypothetical protein [Salmonella enterica]